MVCNDHIDDNICVWEYAQNYIGHGGFYSFMLKIAAIKYFGYPFRKYVVSS